MAGDVLYTNRSAQHNVNGILVIFLGAGFWVHEQKKDPERLVVLISGARLFVNQIEYP